MYAKRAVLLIFNEELGRSLNYNEYTLLCFLPFQDVKDDLTLQRRYEWERCNSRIIIVTIEVVPSKMFFAQTTSSIGPEEKIEIVI